MNAPFAPPPSGLAASAILSRLRSLPGLLPSLQETLFLGGADRKLRDMFKAGSEGGSPWRAHLWSTLEEMRLRQGPTNIKGGRMNGGLFR